MVDRVTGSLEMEAVVQMDNKVSYILVECLSLFTVHLFAKNYC